MNNDLTTFNTLKSERVAEFQNQHGLAAKSGENIEVRRAAREAWRRRQAYSSL
jgi:hypothetical protein